MLGCLLISCGLASIGMWLLAVAIAAFIPFHLTTLIAVPRMSAFSLVHEGFVGRERAHPVRNRFAGERLCGVVGRCCNERRMGEGFPSQERILRRSPLTLRCMLDRRHALSRKGR